MSEEPSNQLHRKVAEEIYACAPHGRAFDYSDAAYCSLEVLTMPELEAIRKALLNLAGDFDAEVSPSWAPFDPAAWLTKYGLDAPTVAWVLEGEQ